MEDAEVHIAALQAAGLIDGPLAARLRAEADGLARTPIGPPPPPTASATASSFFGPSITVGELFAYLGVAFVLGGWVAFVGTLSTTFHPTALMTGGLGLSAFVMFGLGVLLVRGDRRRRRGAGIAFLASTILAAGSAAYFVQLDFLRNALPDQAAGILIAGVAVLVAAGLRRVLPAVATQVGLVLSITGLAGAILSWASSLVYSTDFGSGGGFTTDPVLPPAKPVGLIVASAAWWLLVALGLGLLALREARHEGTDPAAAHRAATTRFLAGIVAVVGTSIELTATGFLDTETYGRLIEPWIADLATLAVAAVLLERAFRRDSTAFVLPGALGLILAMTDLNFTYLADSTYVGLLIEGGILLVVGFVGDRIRRRLGRPDGRSDGRSNGRPMTGGSTLQLEVPVATIEDL